MSPHDFQGEQRHRASLHNVQGDVSLKALHGKLGTTFLGQIYWGAVLHEELMMRLCLSRGSFINAFSSNLNTVNLEIVANQKEHCCIERLLYVLLGTLKDFIRYLSSLCPFVTVLPILYLLRLAKPKVQLALNYIVFTVIFL